MVQVSYPGVYIVEKPSGVHTITGVSTSITAFLGQAREGPINKPVRLLSFANFEKVFGKAIPNVDLYASVKLFFQNGGSECYVVRLSEKGKGKKASLILKNQDRTVDILNFTSKEIGTWGNEICLEIDYNTPNPGDTFHLRILRISSDGSVSEEEKFINCTMDYDSPRFPPTLVTKTSHLVDCELQFPKDPGLTRLESYKKSVDNKIAFSEGRRFFKDIDELKSILDNLPQDDPVKFGIIIDNNAPVEVSISKSEYNTATDELSFKNLLDGKFQDANVPLEADFQNITIDGIPMIVLKIQAKPPSIPPTNPPIKKVSIVPGSSNDMTKELMLGRLQGGLEESTYAFYNPAPNGIFFDTNNDNLDQLSGKHQDFFDTITLDGKDVKLEKKLQTTGISDPWYKAKPPSTDYDGIREKFSLIAQEVNRKLSGWTATVSGLRLLIKKKTGPANIISTISTKLSSSTPPIPNDIGPFFQINPRLYTLGGPVSPFTGSAIMGEEGKPPKLDDYIGNELDHTGLNSLDKVDLFNILVIPDDRSDTEHALTDDDYMSLWAPASVYCKKRRAFLLIGPPRQWSDFEPADILEDSNEGIRSLRTGVVLDYSAVYYPRIQISENGQVGSIDPSGAIAGIMARIDNEIGVWKAPAGLKADFQGGIKIEKSLSDPENGILNKDAINCLRLFPSGLVCWGARTMAGTDDSGETDWRYVPVRRLALYIEESLYRGTKFAVFEPNDEPLWAQLRASVTSFMRKLFKAQALQGRTENEAFFVKCDSETTTSDDQNQGIVNIQVGFAALKPAEFIIITIQQMAMEA